MALPKQTKDPAKDVFSELSLTSDQLSQKAWHESELERTAVKKYRVRGQPDEQARSESASGT